MLQGSMAGRYSPCSRIFPTFESRR
jgi:hypothetical protein